MGGAQGVAAFAFGVDGIPRVDKIVGPGNLFVALAKRTVYGAVDIDSIAGPSEVVVIVDETTRADYTAYDVLAQAEHAPGSNNKERKRKKRSATRSPRSTRRSLGSNGARSLAKRSKTSAPLF